MRFSDDMKRDQSPDNRQHPHEHHLSHFLSGAVLLTSAYQHGHEDITRHKYEKHNRQRDRHRSAQRRASGGAARRSPACHCWATNPCSIIE